MSLLEENSEVKMDSEDRGKDEPWCCSEGAKLNARAPEKFSIHDQDHKVLVLYRETLMAVPNKTNIVPETFFVLASHLSSSHEGSPILLAVSKGELCLCCKKDKGKSKPSLQLKKKKLTKLATQKEKARRPFIFYRAKVGSRYTLESAAHPGWFVYTSCNSGEPVEVTNRCGEGKFIEFSFHQVSKSEMSPSEVSIRNAPLDAFCFPNVKQSPEDIKPAQ
ncbi:interleukin-37 isoform X1 [Lemur catta]|uniref:interleukin-37 isoform X1 n=1 Tax=Lemur catta TaxID=9447 RepID=UPI001E26B3DB|nr:interleukin-37 isoform X1 [Lemur catta]